MALENTFLAAAVEEGGGTRHGEAGAVKDPVKIASGGGPLAGAAFRGRDVADITRG